MTYQFEQELHRRNRLDVNQPEMVGKDDSQPWASMGFFNKEDYDRHNTRHGNRAKDSDSSTGEYEG